MKKLIIEDSLDNLAKFVKESSEHYDQRLKWHDEKIIDNEVDHIKIANLITCSFVMHILIIIYLIIKGVWCYLVLH